MRGLRFTGVFGAGLALLFACDSAQLEQAAPDVGPAFTEAAGDPHPMNANAPSHEDDVSASFAVISNGTVALGVRPNGELNFGGVGLRFLPTGNEAIWVGCLCEGWGAADAVSGIQGWASVQNGGTFNVANVSFASTPSTATSVAMVGGILRVTHAFAPSSATPFLYEIKVTIDNLSGAPVMLRYTRDMDWDVFPTPFNEFVTIQGTAAEPTVLYADNNGFQIPAPLFGRGSLGATGDFIDFGPRDQGALFDFGFGLLAPGASRSFFIYYGAADTEAAALGALAAVGASVYSFGQPNLPGGPDRGVPNTFIFAYRPFQPVDIDIKPGSDPNSIKLGSKGLIPVAILTTPAFDASTVDPATVTLGDGVGTDTPVALRNNGTLHAELEDVDGDGDLDLSLKFDQPTLEANGDLTAASTSLTIKGATFGGTPIQGSDAVRIIP